MTQPTSFGLLISDSLHAQAGEALKTLVRARGLDLHLVVCDGKSGNGPSAEERATIRFAYYSRDLLQGNTKTRPSPASVAFFGIADTAPALEWLHVCTAGTDMPLYRRTLDRGVRLTTSSGSNSTPIAQTAVAAILAQARGFHLWLRSQSQGLWAPLANPDISRDLHEQTAVVVGLGPIGREIGRLLKAAGLTTIGVRRSLEPVAAFDRIVRFDQIDAELPHCDWLVLACPLTPETRGLMSRSRMALLPARAGLVNVARGELVDEVALAHALQNARLRTAYLDVFAIEPLPPDSPLWSVPNLWISPHNAAASPGNSERVTAIFMRNLGRWIEGGPLENEHRTDTSERSTTPK